MARKDVDYHISFQQKKKIIRRLMAELLGTTMLTFLSGALIIISRLSPQQLSNTGVALGAGCSITFIIYMLGHISGSHVNPAVSLTFALRLDFDYRLVPLYWLVQFSGGILAGALLLAFFDDDIAIASTLDFDLESRLVVMLLALKGL
eukprot:TRINITY_DN4999_c0_g1_i1.p1 TRINITY_DN4999_c0_g1~~TRINITY_DN4999_c0_g1_i1.p1  ORF type:complete len:148 (-),score=19.00 TRINITY_DN4999_c0_g1_i1:333-776(-)